MAGARCWGRPPAPGASAHLLRFGIGLSRFEKRLRGRGLDLSEWRGGTPLELTPPTSVSSRHASLSHLTVIPLYTFYWNEGCRSADAAAVRPQAAVPRWVPRTALTSRGA